MNRPCLNDFILLDDTRSEIVINKISIELKLDQICCTIPKTHLVGTNRKVCKVNEGTVEKLKCHKKEYDFITTKINLWCNNCIEIAQIKIIVMIAGTKKVEVDQSNKYLKY